jgi:CheY-like chemotaxis protein/two-component sensor histidine kinase
MESLGRLAGGVAHETNNQMTVVLGFAQHLMKAENITAPQRRDLQQVTLGAQRVAELTRQLLALSRRQMLHPEALDLDALIRESKPLLQRLMGPENTLVVHLDPGLKWVQGDRTQLVQVLLNLVLNARDAMSDGGRVTIRTSRADEVPAYGRFGRSWNSDGAALLSVSDTGSGIDPSISGRVFEPFFTTKPVGQGTGLGLSVVEGIIEQSNGEMWLASEPGEGTTFTIALPLVEAAADTPAQPESSAEGGSETILLVDDEDGVREVLARELQEKGYRLLEASSATQALEILVRQAEEIDLVVTDLAMPGMSGFVLAREATRVSPSLPFIFISGQPRELLPEFDDPGGAHPLLQKPFTPDTLVACVRSTLDLRPHSTRAQA